MVSQFISSHNVALLGDLDFDFPQGIHAIGRLDHNSEGLLILTTNKKVTRLLFSSEEPHHRVYLVQINNKLTQENLDRLQTGVSIRIGTMEYYTASCKAEIVKDPKELYNGDWRQKEYGDHTWLLIGLTEGKFRQVRKMIAALNHRCKRLIRLSIEDLSLDGLQPGQVKEIEEKDFFKKLHIKY